MKRRLISLLAVFCLFACGKAKSADEQTPEPAETPETTEESITTQGGDIEADSPAELKAYQDAMEGSADLRIAWLGELSENAALADVLAAAAENEDLKIVSKIDESRIFYGERGKLRDYVYLIAPAANTDITVGTYSYHAGEIVEVIVEEANALPLIYVESGDHIDPVGMIRYVRHFPDGDTENFMYTGLTADPARLRTDYHMGISDITKYDSMVLPFYGQMFFDLLNSYEEVQAALNSGASLNRMEEMMRDGHAYMVYDLNKDGESTLYGVYYDPLTEEQSVIVSRDRGMTWETLAHG